MLETFLNMSKNDVAMIYICTGKYSVFLDNYLQTCEKYFLPNSNKKYYIFSDTDISDIAKKNNVNFKFIYQEKLPFPLPTLKRFHMINSIKQELINNDYIIFTNANMIFCETVLEQEIIPSEEHNFLFAVEHPGYYNKYDVNLFPYERDLKSSACIDHGFGKKYYQGCFFGGRVKEFLEMSAELQHNIDYDLQIGHMAIWHDESHTNKYFAHMPPRSISPSYSYPEDWDLKLSKKIVQLNKERLGGHSFMRS